jgi:hypothetical protein
MEPNAHDVPFYYVRVSRGETQTGKKIKKADLLRLAKKINVC